MSVTSLARLLLGVRGGAPASSLAVEAASSSESSSSAAFAAALGGAAQHHLDPRQQFAEPRQRGGDQLI